MSDRVGHTERQNDSVNPSRPVGRFLTSRRRSLAVVGVFAPWVVAVVGGALLGTVGRHWPGGTQFVVGCVFAAVLGFVGVPVTIFSWAYLNRKDQT